MKNKEIKILYDANNLVNGAKPTSSRSGLYFTSLNILTQLLKKDNIKISLYVEEQDKDVLKFVLKQYFPDKEFDILTYKPSLSKMRMSFYYNILSEDNNFFFRMIIKILLNMYFYFDILSKNFINLLKALHCKNYDIVFVPSFAIPDFIKLLGIKKKYIFLHDIIPLLLSHYDLTSHCWFAELISDLNKNNNYFANSECTREDFLKYFPQIDPKKIHTVYLGSKVCSDFSEEKLKKVKEKYHIPQDKKYIFSLCTLEPRKNLIRQIKTFAQFVEKNNIDELVLILGGANWAKFVEKLEKEIPKNFENKILKIGYVDDEDLSVLYSGAEWFTFTSEYEGFGLPVLEAMNCGCPVITSNNSSLPEVIGDSGQQITWNSDEEHIQAYEKFYFDEDFRKECIRKGKERAKMFSWDKTVDKMLEIMCQK